MLTKFVYVVVILSEDRKFLKEICSIWTDEINALTEMKRLQVVFPSLKMSLRCSRMFLLTENTVKLCICDNALVFNIDLTKADYISYSIQEWEIDTSNPIIKIIEEKGENE